MRISAIPFASAAVLNFAFVSAIVFVESAEASKPPTGQVGYDALATILTYTVPS